MKRILAALTLLCALSFTVLADGGTEQPKPPCGGQGQTACASIPDDVSFVDEMVEVLSFIFPTF